MGTILAILHRAVNCGRGPPLVALDLDSLSASSYNPRRTMRIEERPQCKL